LISTVDPSAATIPRAVSPALRSATATPTLSQAWWIMILYSTLALPSNF
jgi:hypothetical protein